MMKKLAGSALLLAMLMTQSVAVFATSADSEKAMTEAEIKAIEQDMQKMKALLDTLNKERNGNPDSY